MKIKCLCTARGLIPLYDDDYDNKKRLKVGEVYETDVKLTRNYPFLQKAQSLVSATWSLLDEKQRAAWRSREGLRAYLTVTAGYYEVFYNPRLQEFTEYPKSWSFDKMEENEFQDLYERLKDAVYVVLGKKVTKEVFERVLSNY